jgi:hypothetical protein
MLNKIISGMIMISIGTVLLPEIMNQVGHSAYYYKEEEKPHKQTYLDFVKERLEVERLMK